MLNSKVIFNPGFEQEKEQLTSLYAFRLNMAMGPNRNKYKNEELSNWELAIDKLKACSANKLELNWARTELKRFMMFWNSESKRLAGIFYLYPKNSMEWLEEYNTGIIEKGYRVSSIKYNSGKIIRDWK